ncbi:MAG: proline dehydrogenase family protein [Cyclobacteriaceae bacterium]|jgi:proline dehydrogenase|uniref:Proline dehydrogenase family protein n=1 Tax=Algoriphagus marincola TaxID=264027 RepID=A0ABS7N0J6_9BACT|nr:proline dehydrogenase family protein [Algoriphagus marincola]MBY5949822.1 proline dehydrogenase family protein [Algoriphagus marincola]MCR9081822.1 proline dehydrogenase family protein [Cyclobacteriaceae bacterium]
MAVKPKISFENLEVAFASKTDAELRKMYLIFATLNNNLISDLGVGLANLAFKLKLPIKGIMKKTMFGHFCGGETIDETILACQKLADYGVQAILDLSVEGKGDEESFEKTTEEIYQTMLKSAETDYMPFGVFKTTGLGDFHIMEKIQSGQKLTQAEEKAFDRVKERVDRLCKAAHDLGIRVMVDAEESWFQDVIDDLAYEAMEKYNKERCVVYNTYQMYRHDSLARLMKAHQVAQEKGYLFGAKPVRGAYMEKERERAEDMGYPDPIQPNKAATDRDYDAAIRFCVENGIYLVCASHNEKSNLELTELMDEFGLDPQDSRVFFSQLYGMSDNISFNLAKAGYNVVKYVPYGPVEKVMPYLTRRAAENTSIAGQSSREFELVKREMKRRKGD